MGDETVCTNTPQSHMVATQEQLFVTAADVEADAISEIASRLWLRDPAAVSGQKKVRAMQTLTPEWRLTRQRCKGKKRGAKHLDEGAGGEQNSMDEAIVQSLFKDVVISEDTTYAKRLVILEATEYLERYVLLGFLSFCLLRRC